MMMMDIDKQEVRPFLKSAHFRSVRVGINITQHTDGNMYFVVKSDVTMANYAERKLNVFKLSTNFYLSAYDSIVLNQDKMMVANSSNLAIMDLPEKTVKKFEFCSGCIKMATSLLISNGALYVGGQNEIVKITIKFVNTVVERLPTPLQ